MRVSGRNPTSLFDGVGINYVLFVQGCKHHCRGCHNPSTWDFNGGFEMCVEAIQNHIRKYIPLITGLTISGGDPVYQLDEVILLAEWAKQNSLIVTLYTGFDIEQVKSLLKEYEESPFDYIIDGCYKENCRTTDCAFRGSSNQKIWRLLSDGRYENISSRLDRTARR